MDHSHTQHRKKPLSTLMHRLFTFYLFWQGREEAAIRKDKIKQFDFPLLWNRMIFLLIFTSSSGSPHNECFVDNQCGIQYSGDIASDNFVDFIPTVPDEFSCKSASETTTVSCTPTMTAGSCPSCHSRCTTASRTVASFDQLQEAVVPCDHCSTGPAQWRN